MPLLHPGRWPRALVVEIDVVRRRIDEVDLVIDFGRRHPDCFGSNLDGPEQARNGSDEPVGRGCVLLVRKEECLRV